MRILEILSVGHENAISRQALPKLMACDDRTVRTAAETARAKAKNVEEIVCNFGDGEGYFRAGTIEEAERELYCIESKEKKLHLQSANIKRIIKKHKRKAAKRGR